MIYFLETTVKELESYNKSSIEDLFSKLIEADRYGRHYFVLSDRHLALWALKNLGLSGNHYGHLKSINQEFSFRRGLPKDAKKYLKIVLGDGDVEIQPNEVFCIGHKKFIKRNYSNTETSFVVESITSDSKFYREIFDEICDLTGVPKSYNFHDVHSGGDPMNHVLENEISKSRIVACLVDSDKAAPCDTLGKTAQPVMDILKNRNKEPSGTPPPFVGCVKCTVGREIENIIPYGIIKKLIGKKVTHPDYIDTVAKLNLIVDQKNTPTKADCFWLFYDTKKGLNGEKIMKKCEKKEYFKESVKWMQKKLVVNDSEFEKVLLKGFYFNNGLVNSLLEDKHLLNEFRKFIRTDYWIHLFLETFENILWFFAAPQKTHT